MGWCINSAMMDRGAVPSEVNRVCSSSTPITSQDARGALQNSR
jgi:hypothetical protein